MSRQRYASVNSIGSRPAVSSTASYDAFGCPQSVETVHGRTTREMILSAALKTFSAHGFSGGSIASIARIHGVSPGLIHYYFQNKDELWRAALDHGIGDAIRNLADTLKDLTEVDSVGRLKFFIRRYMAMVAERPDVFRVISQESETRGPRLTWLSKKYLAPLDSLFASLVAMAQAEGEIRVMAPSYHLWQIIAGASYQLISSRYRILETHGIDVLTKDVRDRYTHAVLEVFITGMLIDPKRSES